MGDFGDDGKDDSSDDRGEERMEDEGAEDQNGDGEEEEGDLRPGWVFSVTAFLHVGSAPLVFCSMYLVLAETRIRARSLILFKVMMKEV